MDLHLKNKLFVVGGATAGFGNAVAEALIAGGAKVIAVARNADNLNAMAKRHAGQVEPLAGDITDSQTIAEIVSSVGKRRLAGMLVNAGGPPATRAVETSMEQWDTAYFSVLRWKVELVSALLPGMRKQKYGRILFVESVAVKQPIANLVLSNSMRMAVVGYAKTLSQEVAAGDVTLNVLAPGYHDTEAVKRVIAKKAEVSGTAYEEVRRQIEQSIPVGRMGDAGEFATLAAWLLSPLSGYVTGQTISVDGGMVAGSFG